MLGQQIYLGYGQVVTSHHILWNVITIHPLDICLLNTGFHINTQSNSLNTLGPGKNGRHFEDIFKCIFMNENYCILIQISLKYVSKDQTSNISALVQLMAFRFTLMSPDYVPGGLFNILKNICKLRKENKDVPHIIITKQKNFSGWGWITISHTIFILRSTFEIELSWC